MLEIDIWEWYYDFDHTMYFVGIVYYLLTHLVSLAITVHYEVIQNKIALWEVSPFSLRLLNNMLCLKDNLVWRKMVLLDSCLCAGGSVVAETSNHSFFFVCVFVCVCEISHSI
jgi:hypothetical protein